jgi:hypothetical protein
MLGDQIVRLNEFKRRWPVVTVTPPDCTYSGCGRWVAWWPEENGSSTISRYELFDLLDELERRGFPVTDRHGAAGERP